MKIRLLILLLFYTGSDPAAQQVSLTWAKQAGGSQSESGNDIFVDNLGNSYITGSFAGSADMDPGPGVFNLTAAGSIDVFIAKYNPAGNLVWARQCSGTGPESGTSVAVDGGGNIFVTGGFSGTTDFDPGPGIFSLSANNSYTVFILKLDPGGNFLWAGQLGGDGQGSPTVSLDNAGNIFITDGFEGSYDFDPGGGSFLLNSLNGTDIFVCKLTNNGAFLWARQMSGSGYENSFGSCTDNAGNLYITGDFSGTVDFDPGPGVFQAVGSGNYDSYCCKLDGNGNLVWVKVMGGPDLEQGLAITLDPGGNILLTGCFRGTTDFDPGPAVYTLSSASPGLGDVFVVKLSTMGDLVWARHFGGNQDDIGFGIAADANGNVYTTGFYWGAADFDPGTCVQTSNTFGENDIFVSCLNSAGNFAWMKQLGGPSFDGGYAIATGNGGSVFTTGYFSATADMDPGTGQFNLSSFGSDDVFIHRMGPCANPTTGNATITTCQPYTIHCQTFSNSGTYTVFLPNAAGCDSILTLNLTINSGGTTTNLSASACGSYTWQGNTYTSSGVYRDTLTASNGCDSILIMQLTIRQPASAVISPVICQGQQFAGHSVPGTYRDTLVAANGCDSVRTIHLSVVPPPTPNLGPDRTICPGDTLQLNPGTFDSYTWADGSTNSSVTVHQQGVYTVTVTNGCGIAWDEIRISGGSCRVRFPSGFTPNGDGINDLFRLAGTVSLSEYRLNVFNRWGEKVFETTDPALGWNGRHKGAEQPAGVFTWLCAYRETAAAERVELKGTVVLVR